MTEPAITGGTPVVVTDVVRATSNEESVKAARRCARCGNPAKGFAFINGERYCHGDHHADGVAPSTCYQQATWEIEADVLD